MRVKFCGMRRQQDIEEAVRLGVDFIGLVFVPGTPRCVDAALASRQRSEIDWRRTGLVGVFRDQPLSYVNEVVQRVGLDYVQLHGRETPDYAAAVLAPVWRSLRLGVAGPEALARHDRNVFAYVLDPVDADGQSGGLGVVADDAAVRTALAGLGVGPRVLLAGGLTAQNVAHAVRRHTPWGVDVSSGIESYPGVKDRRRMVAFLEALGRA